MARTTLRAKGLVALPDDIRKAAHLKAGDLLDAELTADGILLRPQKVVDATQAWFWSPGVAKVRTRSQQGQCRGQDRGVRF